MTGHLLSGLNGLAWGVLAALLGFGPWSRESLILVGAGIATFLVGRSVGYKP